jgi:hypothetical protein
MKNKKKKNKRVRHGSPRPGWCQFCGSSDDTGYSAGARCFESAGVRAILICYFPLVICHFSLKQETCLNGQSIQPMKNDSCVNLQKKKQLHSILPMKND